MAQTVGKINGDNFLLYIEGTAVAHSIDATLDLSQETIDTVTKDDSRWNSKLKGNRTYSGSGSGLLAFDPTYGPVDLMDLIIDGTDDVTFKLSNGNHGDIEYSGTVIVTSVSISAPQNSATGYDFSFEGDGALAKVTIAT